MRPRREDPAAIERERRAYLNRVGRIVEGHVVEVADGSTVETSGVLAEKVAATVGAAAPYRKRFLSSRATRSTKLWSRIATATALLRRLAQAALLHLFHSGVTYETAQDITGLEAQLHLDRVAAGQTASVKYDPSNPSNSILLADDWSGLH